MGFAGAIGATIGAISTGVSLIRQRNQAKADAAALQSAQQQQAAQSMLAQQQLEQANKLNELKNEQIRQDVEQRRQSILASLKPVNKPAVGSLKGLDTIYTSPLGDTSEPNYGRTKLLGN